MTRTETEQRLAQLRKQLAMYHAFRDSMAIEAVQREIDELSRGRS